MKTNMDKMAARLSELTGHGYLPSDQPPRLYGVHHVAAGQSLTGGRMVVLGSMGGRFHTSPGTGVPLAERALPAQGQE
jgi:hypothetical protein